MSDYVQFVRVLSIVLSVETAQFVLKHIELAKIPALRAGLCCALGYPLRGHPCSKWMLAGVMVAAPRMVANIQLGMHHP